MASAVAVELDTMDLPPAVKELHSIDDKYLALEKKYEKEMGKLLQKYLGLREPLLKERRNLLADAAEAEGGKGDASTGTPGLKGFWLKALKNHPETDMIYEHDEPVLEYLKDITMELVDEKDAHAGFKLIFRFAKNPFFTNSKLIKEYYVSQPCPYRNEVEIDEIKSSDIEWKKGKNVTVEEVEVPSRSRGTKKQEELQPSFFRYFFVSLKKGEKIPASLDQGEYDDEEEEQDALVRLMHDNHEQGTIIRDYLIPHAVRWFTGEAAPPVPEYDDYSDSYDGESDGNHESD